MAPDDQGERIDIRLELPRAVVEAVILAGRGQRRDGLPERHRLASAVLMGRRRRPQNFPVVSFGEPSWDMILELYVADCAGQRLDVTSLCATTGVSKTTALRHLDRLTEHGLVDKASDPTDSRRTFVLPSEPLRSQIERWLDTEIIARDIGHM